MAAFSNYLENKLIDQIFRGQAFTFPTTLYVSLHTANPTDAGTGTEVSTTGTNYARKDVICNLDNWKSTQNTSGAGTASTGTGGNTKNAVAITFNTPNGGTNWGTISHWGIWDSLTGGNLLLHGALSASKTVNNGDAAPSFAIDALSITLD